MLARFFSTVIWGAQENARKIHNSLILLKKHQFIDYQWYLEWWMGYSQAKPEKVNKNRMSKHETEGQGRIMYFIRLNRQLKIMLMIMWTTHTSCSSSIQFSVCLDDDIKSEYAWSTSVPGMQNEDLIDSWNNHHTMSKAENIPKQDTEKHQASSLLSNSVIYASRQQQTCGNLFEVENTFWSKNLNSNVLSHNAFIERINWK